uniref:Uncharacterized protein n=1 Tax=Romanomermis culicivorax TaxID=13658 RepID=A0A915KRC8_ROMCU
MSGACSCAVLPNPGVLKVDKGRLWGGRLTMGTAEDWVQRNSRQRKRTIQAVTSVVFVIGLGADESPAGLGFRGSSLMLVLLDRVANRVVNRYHWNLLESQEWVVVLFLKGT